MIHNLAANRNHLRSILKLDSRGPTAEKLSQSFRAVARTLIFHNLATSFLSRQPDTVLEPEPMHAMRLGTIRLA